MLALFLIVAGVVNAEKSQMGVSPVEKVISMLNDMMAKGKSEKHDEQVQFAKYKAFCEATSKEKASNIASAKEAIEQLKADAQKAEADAMVLTKEIALLGTDIDGWIGEKEEALAIRAKEHADFVVVHTDYTEAMDAVERALQVLKGGPGQSFVQVRESLLQLQAFTAVPSHAQKALNAYLRDAEPDMSLLEEASETKRARQQPKTYESSSGGVIDMVKKLGDKFKAERYELEKAEAKKQHASDMIVQDLTDSIERATTARDEKMSTKAQREKDKSSAEGDLADTIITLDENTKFLSDLSAECETKSVEFEKNQVLRAGELEAVGKAIEIMSSDAVSGGTQHLPGLVQQGVSLAQLRVDQRSSLQSRVAVFLNDRAERTNSRILSLIAVKIREDPFKKVTKMIRDMIAKLMEEANEEAEHKGFCDTEMGTNKNTRDEKSEKV